MQNLSNNQKNIIYVIDDDEPFRRSLIFLLESAGWQAQGFASAESYLNSPPNFPSNAGVCLVIDVRLPRMSGLALQHKLNESRSLFPIIFITGHGDIDLAVQTMKNGAVDFLQKPFKEHQFLDAVDRALKISSHKIKLAMRNEEAKDKLLRLSQRETEIAKYIALGLANKEIAKKLMISDNTVHVHRQHIMEKTKTSSAAEIARLILYVNPDGLE